MRPQGVEHHGCRALPTSCDEAEGNNIHSRSVYMHCKVHSRCTFFSGACRARKPVSLDVSRQLRRQRRVESGRHPDLPLSHMSDVGGRKGWEERLSDHPRVKW